MLLNSSETPITFGITLIISSFPKTLFRKVSSCAHRHICSASKALHFEDAVRRCDYQRFNNAVPNTSTACEQTSQRARNRNIYFRFDSRVDASRNNCEFVLTLVRKTHLNSTCDHCLSLSHRIFHSCDKLLF